MKKLLISLIVAQLVCLPLSADTSSSTLKNNKIKKTTSTKETSKKNKNTHQELINKIVMVVYTDDEPIIITQHDIERKSLDGHVRTSQEVLFDRLKYYEATNYYKISGYQEDAQKHITAIKSEHGLQDDQLAPLFKESGYTVEEGIEELRMVYAIRRLMQELITNRIVVSEKEIRDYFNHHPLCVPASYKVRKGMVSKSALNEDQIQDLFAFGKNKEDVVWSASYWIAENELAEHKKFITGMAIDQVMLSEELDNEYEVVQLLKSKPAHTKTFEERYNEILQTLRFPKYDELMKAYEQELLKKYEVVYY